MQDESKTKAQLIAELEQTHNRVAEIEQVEVALRESEERYRSLVESTDDAVYLLGRDMRYEFANRKYLSRLGLSLAELIGQEYGKLHPWDKGEELAKKVDQVIKSGKPMTYEYLSHRDGRYFLRTLSPVIGEKPGEIRVITITSKDITERKKAEEKIQEQYQFLEHILDSLTHPFCVLNVQNYSIIKANYAAGIGSGDMGEKCYALTHYREEPCDDPDHPCPLKEVKRTKKPVVMEHIHYDKDGDARTFEVHGFPLFDIDGNVIQMIEYNLDITERRKAEEDLKRSHDQLRGLAVHVEDLREAERVRIAREIHDDLGQALLALNTDISWVKKKLPADQVVLLEKMKAILASINDTIQSVRRISRDLRPAMLESLGLLSSIEWYVNDLKKRTGLTCKLAFRPETLELDEKLSVTLFRIVQEALTNVVRHANTTQADVKLEEMAGQITLVIQDNGKGITNTQIKAPGSLGLIGMRERVYPWGGEVHIEGHRGKGTTITVFIPGADKGGMA